MKTYRVFPRETSATPKDALAFVGDPPLLLELEADKVEISVAFTYDMAEAERLEKEWRQIAPVEIGGPAVGDPAGEFIPGRYLEPGYTITSRGCPNRCWFCSVWRREGNAIKELAIKPGNIVQDDNLLACSKPHIEAVFAMLKTQPYGAVKLAGLEAAILKEWHVQLFTTVSIDELFFAHDTPDDYEPLIAAGKLLTQYGFTLRKMQAYVLIGYRGDTFDKAEKRLIDTYRAGFMPRAMVYRDERGFKEPAWQRFQKTWMRPAATKQELKRLGIYRNVS